MTKVTVRVPATTANLGPGFDCLGLALEIYNEVTVEVAEEPRLTVQGEGEREIPPQGDNLVWRAVETCFRAAGKRPPKLHLTLRNQIPLSRGLGSSAAAVVGGLVASNALLSHALTDAEILRMATRMEGHPDNVAAALNGGLTIVIIEGDTPRCLRVPVPDDLTAVLFIPEFPMSTSAARKALPQQYRRSDAVFNIGRAATLVAAMATGQLEFLREATEDRLHQPFRQRIFPAMTVLFSAALEAGALGAFLSGAGSTICAFTRGGEPEVARAMEERAARLDVHGKSVITRVARAGAQVVEQ